MRGEVDKLADMEKTDKFEAFITCPDEMTYSAAEELAQFGAGNIRREFRVVYFSTDRELYYRLHLQLSMAGRISHILKEIPAQRAEIIFDKARRIRWDRLFSADEAIMIRTASAGAGQKIENHLIGSKIREAINDTFLYHRGRLPEQRSEGALLAVNAYLRGKRLVISLDTSGSSLHRRGYRLEGHDAPLKETLASAMLKFCGYDGTQVLCDPMCGSGTIPVEAARIASGKAALSLRRTEEFGLSRMLDFDRKLFEKNRTELVEQSEKRSGALTSIYASDISEESVLLARRSAEIAGVDMHLEFSVRDFFSYEKPAETGILIANIPYGQRLQEGQVNEGYLRRMGAHLRDAFRRWRAGLLIPAELDWKKLGLRTSAVLPLRNGRIKVNFVVCDID